MSKYKVGDKFIINIKEVLESEKGTLYRADYNTLTFDDYGLDGLQKHDALQERLELIDELKQAEYNKGLNDGRNEVWELVKKLRYLGNQKCKEIFGYEFSIDIIEHFTPQEALAKLKAYEEAQKIEVGDVIKYPISETVGIVTKVYDNDYAYICFKDGSCGLHETIGIQKTGKHIDIKSILESIGE